jgi:hypothetical protein
VHRLTAMITALLALLKQMEQVLDQLDPEAYGRPLPEFGGGTLGQHFRHILEFFQCLEKGLASGLVDYDAREREVLYETDPTRAAGALAAFCRLAPGFDLHRPLRLYAELGTDHRPVVGSTLGRELVFVYDHAIHHLAIIRIGLRCHFPGVRVDADFGLSPSTVKALRLQLDRL